MKKKMNSLIKLAKRLNHANITWGLGGSMLLYLEGYQVTVDDIDIIVDVNDYDLLLETLKNDIQTYNEPNMLYKTKHIFSLNIDDVDIDIMVGFKVNNGLSIYEFPFNKSEVHKTITLEKEAIHLCKVTEWLKAYEAMNRLDKIDIIKAKNIR